MLGAQSTIVSGTWSLAMLLKPSKRSRNGKRNLVALRGKRQWHPTSVLLPEKSCGWRSLVGCRPWGRYAACQASLSITREAGAAGTEGVGQGQSGTSSSSPGGEGQEKDGKPGPQGAFSQAPQRLGNWGCPACLLGLRELQASSHLRGNKASVFSSTKEL